MKKIKFFELFVLSVLVSISTSCKSCKIPTGPDLKPMISFFHATPTETASGNSVTLSWNVFNATSVTIDQGIGGVALQGTIQVKPETTTSYKLAATNAAGTVTQSVTVTIIPYPSEIVGEYRMGGGPVILKGNRWEITLKSLEIVESIYDPVCNMWWACDNGNKLFIYRFKDKVICPDSGLIPTPGSGIQSSNGETYNWSNENELKIHHEHHFPGEIRADLYMLKAYQEIEMIKYIEVPERGLSTQLSIVWNDDSWLTPKQKPQKFIFNLILN